MLLKCSICCRAEIREKQAEVDSTMAALREEAQDLQRDAAARAASLAEQSELLRRQEVDAADRQTTLASMLTVRPCFTSVFGCTDLIKFGLYLISLASWLAARAASLVEQTESLRRQEADAANRQATLASMLTVRPVL